MEKEKPEISSSRSTFFVGRFLLKFFLKVRGWIGLVTSLLIRIVGGNLFNSVSGLGNNKG